MHQRGKDERADDDGGRNEEPGGLGAEPSARRPRATLRTRQPFAREEVVVFGVLEFEIGSLRLIVIGPSDARIGAAILACSGTCGHSRPAMIALEGAAPSALHAAM